MPNRSVGVQEFLVGSREKGALLLDVRSPSEFEEAHIPGLLYWMCPEMVIATRYSPRPARFDVTRAVESEIVDWRDDRARCGGTQ